MLTSITILKYLNIGQNSLRKLKGANSSNNKISIYPNFSTTIRLKNPLKLLRNIDNSLVDFLNASGLVVAMSVPILNITSMAPFPKKNAFEQKQSKSYSHFRYILVLRVIFGYNYLPFETSRAVQFLIKSYCIIICVTASAVTLYNLDEISFWPYLFVIAEYIITVFISCMLNAKNREKFFKYLESVDCSLNIQFDYYKKIRRTHNIIAFVAVITRTFYAVSFCFCFNDMCSSINIVLSNFIAMAVDINQLPRVIIFYMIYYQIRMLRLNMENTFKSQQIHNYKSNYNSVDDFLHSYKTLLDHADRLKRAIKILVISLFFFFFYCGSPLYFQYAD